MPDAPAPRSKSSYLDNATLCALIRAYRRRKRTPEAGNALGRALLAIAGGVWDRYRYTSDREEFCQEVVIHLLQRPLEKADVQKHLFNYFTTCTIRYGQKLRERAYADRRRFETYAAECVEAGREFPTTTEHFDRADLRDVNQEEDAPPRRKQGRPVQLRRLG